MMIVKNVSKATCHSLVLLFSEISEAEQTMSVTEGRLGGKGKCSEPEGRQHCQPGTR